MWWSGIRRREKATKVSYFGHVLSGKEVQPDQKKIAAIQDMEPPKSKSEVLGMVNYLKKFTPNLPKATAPTGSLLKEDFEFVWDGGQDSAFKDMKMLIPSAGTLACFDKSKSVTLGLTLPNMAWVKCYYRIANLSRMRQNPSPPPPPTEQEYAQIEKEMCAIVFGAKRFH